MLKCKTLYKAFAASLAFKFILPIIRNDKGNNMTIVRKSENKIQNKRVHYWYYLVICILILDLNYLVQVHIFKCWDIFFHNLRNIINVLNIFKKL